MFTIGLAVALTLAAFIALGIHTNKAGDLVWSLRKKQFLSLIIFGFVWLTASFTTIPVNSVGVVFNQFTGVSNTVMGEGFHVKSPFDTVYVISTEIQTQKIEGLYVQTKTSQYLTLVLEVKYQITENNAVNIFKKFRNIKTVNADLLSSAALKSASEITTTYGIMEILGEKRNEVQGMIQKELGAVLENNGVNLVNMVLIDTDAGVAIESAIEAEAVAKKAVETAKQAQAKAEIEANTKVIQSEAAAKVVLIEAQAEADANKLKTKAITPEILMQMEMEARIKWGWITIQGAQAVVVTDK